MHKVAFIVSLLCLGCAGRSVDDAFVQRCKAQAGSVTVIRDRWGIPHVYGATDADAVFGLMYAQCEENFGKVERAYIERLGRLTEVDGAQSLYNDLLTRLLTDTAWAQRTYAASPPWLQQLLNAFADGVNYYLYKHPEVKPLLLKRFEPWYPLLFADGAYVSVKTGGLTGDDFLRMYAVPSVGTIKFLQDTNALTGSNAFAIAPAKTDNNRALLYINPHVSFDFRTEAHTVSEEGLNAYGAVTWGQFFVFQGFNDRCGWMHTSSQSDAVDLYEEEVVENNGKRFTAYNGGLKPVTQKTITFRLPDGREEKLTAYYTHHGPVVGRTVDGKWLSLKTMPLTVNALIQSWSRTKAKNLEEFKTALRLATNATTNTLYADDKGNIAYWHGNFVPKRAAALDWSRPVDGRNAATDWQDAHKLEELPFVENPAQGFIQNCNSTPFTACGPGTLSPSSYPIYMAPEGENFRSAWATQLLSAGRFNTDKLIEVGYNRRLTAFDSMLPLLFEAYNDLPSSHSWKTSLKEPIELMKGWDKNAGVQSIATTLAVYWADGLFVENGPDATMPDDQPVWMPAVIRNLSAEKRLHYLNKAVLRLRTDFGKWQVPWGEANRYRRTAGDKASTGKGIPVGLASAFYGSLPAYETQPRDGRLWGVAGNSFVAAVEFGDSVRAKAVVPGGQSFDPSSKHFSDQAELYINGRLRDVFFYRTDVEKNAEKKYHPGEE